MPSMGYNGRRACRRGGRHSIYSDRDDREGWAGTREIDGVAPGPHLRNIQATDLSLGRGAHADDSIDNHEEDVAQTAHVDEAGDDADALRHELAWIAEEQPGHVAVDAVPYAAIVARSVGKQTSREYSPGAIDTVHGDGANRVVHFSDIVEEPHRPAHQHAGDQTD